MGVSGPVGGERVWREIDSAEECVRSRTRSTELDGLKQLAWESDVDRKTSSGSSDKRDALQSDASRRRRMPDVWKSNGSSWPETQHLQAMHSMGRAGAAFVAKAST